MIVLWPWSYYRAFVVIIELVTNIPIEPVMQFDRESHFRRLEAHRVRSDQGARISRRISYAASLPSVFVDSISRKQRRARCETGHRFHEEEVVPRVIEAVAKWMLNAVEEVIDDGFTVNPMVIVAAANREIRSAGPLD